jgi:hypothetical protein
MGIKIFYNGGAGLELKIGAVQFCNLQWVLQVYVKFFGV